MHITLPKQLRSAAILSLISFVLQTILCIIFEINSSGALYFHSSAYTFLWVLQVVAPLLMIIFLFPHKSLPTNSTSAIPIPLRLCSAVTFLAVFYFGITHCMRGGTDLADGLLQSAIFAIITGAFAVLGSLHFLFIALPVRRSVSYEALTEMALALALVFYPLYLYFEGTSPKNASYKLLFSFAFLMLLLFVLSDIRLLLGRARPRMLYIILFSFTPLFGALSLGSLIAGVFHTAHPINELPASLVLLAFFLYIIIKTLFVYIVPSDKAPHPVWASPLDTVFSDDEASYQNNIDYFSSSPYDSEDMPNYSEPYDVQEPTNSEDITESKKEEE